MFTNPYNVARKPVKNQFSEHEESNPNTDYNTQMFVSRVDMTLDNFVKNIAWKVREMNKEYERNEDNLMRNYKILPHQEISNLNVNSTLNMNPYHYKIFR